VDVDRPRVAVVGAAPQRLEQRLARVDAAGLAASVRSSSNSRYVSWTARPETSDRALARSIRTPSTSMASLLAPAGGSCARRSAARTRLRNSRIAKGFVM
jgi:hypothetical protein